MTNQIKWGLLGKDYEDYTNILKEMSKRNKMMKNKLETSKETIDNILENEEYEDALTFRYFTDKEGGNIVEYINDVRRKYMEDIDKSKREEFNRNISNAIKKGNEVYEVNNHHKMNYYNLHKIVSDISEVLNKYNIQSTELRDLESKINEAKSKVEKIKNDIKENKDEFAKLFVAWGNRKEGDMYVNQGVEHILGVLPINYQRYFENLPSSAEEIKNRVITLGDYTHQIVKQTLPKLIENPEAKEIEYTLDSYTGRIKVNKNRIEENRMSFDVDIPIKLKYDDKKGLVPSEKEGVDYIIDVRLGVFNGVPYYFIDSIRPVKGDKK